MVRTLCRSVWISLAVVAFIAVAPIASAQQDFPAGEKAAMRAYVLTPQKVNGYIAATNALAAAAKSDASLAREIETKENEPGDTLAEMRAMWTSRPRLFAFYQRQGLSTDDVVILPVVFITAGAVVELKDSTQAGDTVSPAQVAFVRANPGLSQRLSEAFEALGDTQ